MTTRTLAPIALASLLGFASMAWAEDPRPQLAKVRAAWIEPADELAADVPVAFCLTDHLASMRPMRLAASRAEADAIFTVSANVPSATTPFVAGMFGGTPSISVKITQPDGTPLWEDGATLRRAIGKAGTLESSDAAKGVECGLADEWLDHLRKAMKEARAMRETKAIANGAQLAAPK
jgi:hypothetical protein